MPFRLLTVSLVLVTISILLKTIPVQGKVNPAERFRTCSTNEKTMTQFMGGGVNQDLGYIFNVTALSNTTFTVGVWGSKDPAGGGNQPFIGLLLWATDFSGQRVGNWRLRPDNMGYRLICDNRAITHDAVGGRSMLSIDPARPYGFLLTVPVGVPQPIVFRGAIIESMDKWQILTPTPAPPLDPDTARAALATIRANNWSSSLFSPFSQWTGLLKSISFTGLSLSLLTVL